MQKILKSVPSVVQSKRKGKEAKVGIARTIAKGR